MDKFIEYDSNIANVDLPQQFTYPFYYEPHPLAVTAARELQSYLEKQKDFNHRFWWADAGENDPIGKMFGVLVVRCSSGELGYLAGVSGKLADSNHHLMFVPPVFDMLAEDGFFKMGEREIVKLTEQISVLESDPKYVNDTHQIEHLESYIAQQISDFKSLSKESKARRTRLKEVVTDDPIEMKSYLRSQSLFFQYTHRDLEAFWREKLGIVRQSWRKYHDKIEYLKSLRKKSSIDLQEKIFEQYRFLNVRGEFKSLKDLFVNERGLVPPAGAGECAAPKLLQYAFAYDLQPVALAEFWWGEAPSSEIRKHKHFYTACRGKCLPILTHMLEGLDVEPNPLVDVQSQSLVIETLYEDKHLLVVDKPAGLLAAPGKDISDCVQTRLQKKYPKATGPMIVHRLDMDTSGIMLIAKSMEVYKLLQQQFIKNKIEKTYTADLEGVLYEDGGMIDLPLRVDLDDRPRQLVCYDHGKSARTRWKKISVVDGVTRVHFYPITGRTHQLRVHAAHPSGLDTPIVGDTLYGRRGERLHLHASMITFRHPETNQYLSLESDCPF